MSRDQELEASLAVPPGGACARIPAPELSYRPLSLSRTPRIALVGCGSISATHLEAYRDAGYDVVALHSRTRERAEARRDEYFPRARVTDDLGELLAVEGLDAVDLTPHPADRVALIEAAIDAGVPVLSQKPLALDLETARRLVSRAERAGVPFAVNQNGRFAPHLAWMREAVCAGLVGEVTSVRVSIQWDHNWVAGTPFDDDPNLLLRDFGIHWFDLVASLIPAEPRRVHATTTRSPAQAARPALLGAVLVEYDEAQVTLAFDGDARVGQEDTTRVLGTRGALRSTGPPLRDQRVTLWTQEGQCEPQLEGSWFPGAFHAAMAELLDAAWTGREPLHSARDNLRSLELCERAVAAAARGS